MLARRIREHLSFLAATPLHPQWLLRFAPSRQELLRLSEGTILDVGSADRWPERFIPRKTNYIALDYPQTGKALYASKPDIFADAAALPIVSNTIDTVLYFEVLEHVTRPSETIEEISRVLKPGGQLIMSMPFLYPMHDEPHDFQRYTKHGLERDFRAAGLELKSIKPTLNAASTSGLIACLALSGMILRALKNRSPSLLMTPLLICAIPIINIIALTIGWVMPNWDAIAAGHQAIARKPENPYIWKIKPAKRTDQNQH